jgi:hypothetical protein
MVDVHGRKRHDIYTSQRSRRAESKSATWDLSATWRYRWQEGQQFLSSPERRFLKEVLTSLEKSGQDLTGVFPIRTIGPASSCAIRFARPLQGLLARGLVEIIAGGAETWQIDTVWRVRSPRLAFDKTSGFCGDVSKALSRTRRGAREHGASCSAMIAPGAVPRGSYRPRAHREPSWSWRAKIGRGRGQ